MCELVYKLYILVSADRLGDANSIIWRSGGGNSYNKSLMMEISFYCISANMDICISAIIPLQEEKHRKRIGNSKSNNYIRWEKEIFLYLIYSNISILSIFLSLQIFLTSTRFIYHFIHFYFLNFSLFHVTTTFSVFLFFYSYLFSLYIFILKFSSIFLCMYLFCIDNSLLYLIHIHSVFIHSWPYHFLFPTYT